MDDTFIDFENTKESKLLSRRNKWQEEFEKHLEAVTKIMDKQYVTDQNLSIRDIYKEMIRNQELDHQNFSEPKMIKKCIDQKLAMSTKLIKQKKKIWRPNYK